MPSFLCFFQFNLHILGFVRHFWSPRRRIAARLYTWPFLSMDHIADGRDRRSDCRSRVLRERRDRRFVF